MRRTTFSGTTVFLSRNLVPYELYDAVHDALKLNGAQVYLCSDHSRNSSNEYHVISDHHHDKFEFFKSKGCNLLGPQCILSCAKEHRILPKQSYTCCLAMDGVKVLASGFERDEKAIIGQLVTAMGGVLQAKATLDVNFVIVKDVLAAKYKYAINVLKKPVVSLDWLHQCWIEHRVVPQEQFRILPFTGLTICVTRIPVDERKELEKLIVQNGGRYSASLTKKCTHLVSDAPVGDKYIVAQNWGHIHIITRKWVDQSIAKRVCLDEGLYDVAGTPSLSTGPNNIQKEYSYQDFSNASSQPPSHPITEDLESSISRNVASTTDAQPATDEIKDDPTYDCCVAEDSEAEDSDLYLSDCRIFIVGFEEKEHSKLVNMIRKGGGTRHMLLSDRLTHIVFGTPSEDEKREIRCLSAWGVINVVKSSWLEECDKTKRELPVFPRHSASELLVSKEPSFKVSNDKKVVTSEDPTFKWKMFAVEPSENSRRVSGKPRGGVTNDIKSNPEVPPKSPNSTVMKANCLESISRMKSRSCTVEISRRSSDVFKAKSFSFSSSFPMEQRPEVMEWIKDGGGVLVDERRNTNVDFIIERHGQPQFDTSISQSSVISTHWIRSSLDEGMMQDIRSHILYTPLPCCIPFPGFECLRFCVSQYEEKERLLLKNLCVVLGAKFSSKLTKKTTHLLCKFANGPKYDAACKWGVQSVSADWIEKCITQGKVAPLDMFRPRAVTKEDREAGLCTVTQYPTQATTVFSAFSRSQASDLTTDGKRRRLQELNSNTNLAKKNKLLDNASGGSVDVADVADAIEDLLAHSNMMPSPSGRDQCRFSSDPSPVIDQSHGNSHSTYQNLSQRPNRTDKQNLISDPYPVSNERRVSAFDSFSETQTELQVVGYEEDLTGRQKIIDRVRSQTYVSPPDK